LNGAFIEAWTHAQLWLWRNYCNINGLLMFIGQACGANAAHIPAKPAPTIRICLRIDGFSH
jgi:hypothetical protein